MIGATEAALAHDADLLGADEAAAIAALLDRVRAARAGTDRGALTAAVDALNRGTESFAARRMDRGVSRALTGRRVDAVLQERD